MTGVLITVNGSAEEFHQPQRATVTVRVGFEGAGKDAVRQRTVDLAEHFAMDIKKLHNPQGGPVTWYSQAAITTWTEKPWNQDGKQLPPVFHAAILFQVKFADFTVLSGWADHWASVEGVSLSGVEWTLTDGFKREVTDRVRTNAVRAAREKAQAYADSLDLGPVTATQLADIGMLGEQRHGNPGAVATAGYSARASKAESSSPAAIVPQDVQIKATVDAQFITNGHAG